MKLTLDSEGFPRTHWSFLVRAGEGGRQELEVFCRAYWMPLYAYARRKGHTTESAQDRVQSFLLAFLERGTLAQVAPDTGRFRAYLLTSFKNFSISERRRERAQKRGGDSHHLSLDWLLAEKAYQVTDPALDAESLYHRQWALTLLLRVEEMLAERYRVTRRQKLFEAIRPSLREVDAALDYHRLAAELDMTRGALRVAVHRLRSRYAMMLREEVLLLVDGAADLDQELRELLDVIRPRTSHPTAAEAP